MHIHPHLRDVDRDPHQGPGVDLARRDPVDADKHPEPEHRQLLHDGALLDLMGDVVIAHPRIGHHVDHHLPEPAVALGGDERIRGQLLHRDVLFRRERMRRGAIERQGLIADLLRVEVDDRPVGHEKPHVGPVLQHIGDRDLEPPHLDEEFNLRVVAGELRERPVQPARRDRPLAGNVERMPRAALARERQVFRQQLRLAQQFLAAFVEPPALFGERRDGAAPPREQLAAHLVLERAHMVRDRGVRDAELLRGADETARIHHRDEHFEPPECHGYHVTAPPKAESLRLQPT